MRKRLTSVKRIHEASRNDDESASSGEEMPMKKFKDSESSDDDEDEETIFNHGFSLDEEDIIHAEGHTSFVPAECLLLDEGDDAPDFTATLLLDNKEPYESSLSDVLNDHKRCVLVFFSNKRAALRDREIVDVLSSELSNFKELETFIIGITTSKTRKCRFAQIVDKTLWLGKNYKCLSQNLDNLQTIVYVIDDNMKILRIFHGMDQSSVRDDLVDDIKTCLYRDQDLIPQEINSLTHSPFMDSIHDASSKLLVCLTGETVHDGIMEFVSETMEIDNLFESCDALLQTLFDIEIKTRKVWEIIIIYVKKIVAVLQKIHKDYKERVDEPFTKYWKSFSKKVYSLYQELKVSSKTLTLFQRNELMHKMIRVEKEGKIGEYYHTDTFKFKQHLEWYKDPPNFTGQRMKNMRPWFYKILLRIPQENTFWKLKATLLESNDVKKK